MIHNKYRPDIDGLRAIAILVVVAYHASSHQMPGGFIGVDIFFVISGFLISSIIFSNLDKNQFSYTEFYSRRIRRIFPALLVVLCAAWLLGWYVLFFDEFAQLGKHIASGMAFVSNLTLWTEAGYFDSSAESKPLLHLWSLGIEEQFYILYPVLLGLVWRHKLNFFNVILTVAIISFALNIYWVMTNELETAFYLPLSRFWELMAGGMIAYMLRYKDVKILAQPLTQNVMAILGVSFIVITLAWVDSKDAFPGWWALLPVLGACLLILSPYAWLNQKLLANKLMVFIGLISYPLYLWHWLLLSFGYILGLDSKVERLTAVGLSFVLAWLTFVVVEQRIRFKKGAGTVKWLLFVSVVLLALGLFTAKEKVTPRNDSETIRLAVAAAADWAYPNGLDEIQIQGMDVYIKEGGEKRVLFYGDSHIEQYAPRIVKLIDSDKTKMSTAIFATRGACPPIPGVFQDNRNSCTPAFKKVLEGYALSADVDAVVIGARWEYYLNNPRPSQGQFSHFYIAQDSERNYLIDGGTTNAKRALEDLLTQIAKHKQVFLVLDNPDAQALDPKVLLTQQRLSQQTINLESAYTYSASQMQLYQEMKAMALRAGVTIIDPIPHFCPGFICRSKQDDGQPIYKDSNHIRSTYMRDNVDYIDVTVKK